MNTVATERHTFNHSQRHGYTQSNNSQSSHSQSSNSQSSERDCSQSPAAMEKASTADTLPPTISVPYIPGGSNVSIPPNPVLNSSTRSRETEKEAQPPVRSHLRLWKRIFGSRSLGKHEGCAIQEKNTFIHFDDPDPDLIPTEPPAKSAPGGFVFIPSASRKGDQPVRTTSQRSMASSIHSSVDSIDSSPGGEHRQIVLANEALDRTKALSGGQVSLAEEVVHLSQVVNLQKAHLGSIGSAGHCSGNCMPCLMQVRWRAGKCVDPCKFGALCGRCHEAHSEEQLQKIQAKMRKLKKRVVEEKTRTLPAAAFASVTSKLRGVGGGGGGGGGGKGTKGGAGSIISM